MSALLAAEWVKLRRRWMVYIVIGINLLLVAIFFWGLATRAENRIDLVYPRGWLAALFVFALFPSFLWPIISGNWAGSEYTWGTVRTILSRRPNRIAWALAALITLTLTAAAALIAAMILGTIAGAVVSALTGHPFVDTSGLPANFVLLLIKLFLAAWLVLAFYVLLAYTAGTVFRSGAFGIGLGIGITVAQLIATGIFEGLGGTWKTIAQHFPYQYASVLPQRLIAEGATRSFGGGLSNAPSVGACVIGLVIYSAILLAITLAVVRIRDVTS